MKALASLLLIAYLSAAAADSAEVSYEVHFTEEEMTLDCRADEQSWSLAPPIELTDRAYPQPKADYPCKHEGESSLERTRTLGLVPVSRPEHFGNGYPSGTAPCTKTMTWNCFSTQTWTAPTMSNWPSTR